MDIYTLQVAYVGLVLLIAGVLDAVYREVEPLYWYIATKAGILVSIAVAGYGASLYGGGYYYLLLVYTLLSLIPVAVVGVLYKLCMIGGADVGAIAFIALSMPVVEWSLLPPVYLILLYTLVPLIAYNIYVSLRHCRGLRAGCLKGSIDVDRDSLLSSKEYRWWMPEVEGCSIEGYKDELVFRYHGGSSGTVKASPGNPYVAFIAIAYLIFLLLGDYPIRYFIG